MYKKTCEVCGKEFESVISRSKYCSTKCKSKSHYEKKRKIQIQKTCEICGKEFVTTREYQKYCSEECRLIQHKQVCADYYFRKTVTENRLPTKRFTNHEFLVDEVFDSNPMMLEFRCDECGTVYYSRLSMYPELDVDNQSYTKVDKVNTTEWGAPYCPKCGLVHEDPPLPESPKIGTKKDYEEWWKSISKIKTPIPNKYKKSKKFMKPGRLKLIDGVFVPKQAQYFEDDERVYDEIDFIREGEIIANMRKHKLTDDDYSTLISATFKQFR